MTQASARASSFCCGDAAPVCTPCASRQTRTFRGVNASETLARLDQPDVCERHFHQPARVWRAPLGGTRPARCAAGPPRRLLQSTCVALAPSRWEHRARPLPAAKRGRPRLMPSAPIRLEGTWPAGPGEDVLQNDARVRARTHARAHMHTRAHNASRGTKDGDRA